MKCMVFLLQISVLKMSMSIEISAKLVKQGQPAPLSFGVILSRNLTRKDYRAVSPILGSQHLGALRLVDPKGSHALL